MGETIFTGIAKPAGAASIGLYCFAYNMQRPSVCVEVLESWESFDNIEWLDPALQKLELPSDLLSTKANQFPLCLASLK